MSTHKQIRRVYVHVPFCRRRCAYCAFQSVAMDPLDSDAADAYLTGISESAARFRDSLDIGLLDSLYVGGGTPTHLGAGRLDRLLTTLSEKFPLNGGAEVTVECNPATLTSDAAGILAERATRISLGIQSLSSGLLSVLGRVSPPDAGVRAIETLNKLGARNLSADFIYGIPGQSIQDCVHDLKSAADWGLRHVSAYALTLEEGHELSQGRFDEIADDDAMADIWTAAGEILGEAGVPRYEVSNYAAPGAECAHNLGIWLGDPYLGLGPSASSYNGVNRWTEPSGLELWLGGTPPESDPLPKEARDREVFVMGLRTTRGWSDTLFRNVRGASWRDWNLDVEGFTEAGLLIEDGSGIRLTDKGLLLWDGVAGEILWKQTEIPASQKINSGNTV